MAPLEGAANRHKPALGLKGRFLPAQADWPGNPVPFNENSGPVRAVRRNQLRAKYNAREIEDPFTAFFARASGYRTNNLTHTSILPDPIPIQMSVGEKNPPVKPVCTPK
jgi:hypothetical protein